MREAVANGDMKHVPVSSSVDFEEPRLSNEETFNSVR